MAMPKTSPMPAAPTRPDPTWKPEKPRYRRLVLKTLLILLTVQATSALLYVLLLQTMENQMLGDDIERRFRWIMFGFSALVLIVTVSVLSVMYLRNAERKRGFLSATAASVVGEGEVAAGYRFYRSVALRETIAIILTVAVYYLPITSFYTYALATSGEGYGYGRAFFFEDFFVGYIGLAQPFQNAWIGYLIALAAFAGTSLPVRIGAHKVWDKERIRR